MKRGTWWLLFLYQNKFFYRSLSRDLTSFSSVLIPLKARKKQTGGIRGTIAHSAGVLVTSFFISRIYKTKIPAETRSPSRQSLICIFLSLNIKKFLFVFDEPTTGHHFHDLKKLLTSLNALIEQGHSIVVVGHYMYVIRSADWVIDLGPEAGDEGGNLVFARKPAVYL